MMIKFKSSFFTYLILSFVLTNHIFSEENSIENEFSGNWIEYSRWGFQIKTISEGKEIIETYNDFGKLTSKKTLSLTFPNGKNSEGQYLIMPNDDWHYLTGKKKPNNLSWSSENFDITMGNWKQGKAGFGYADNDDKTILGKMVNEYQSVFIRKEFTIEKGMDLSRLMLAINFDDSFALHLNGRYIFSINVVNETGQIEVTDHEANGFEFFPLGAYSDALNIGKNVIGIEGYNKSLNSSDFTLDPYLTIGGGYINYSKNDPENNVTIRGGYMLRDEKLQESVTSEDSQPSTLKTFHTLDTPQESLLLAARNGNIKKVQELLSLDVNVDFFADNSYTALGYAAAKEDIKMMDLLVEKGANVNGLSKGGKTPILIAAGAGKRESLEFLMTKGADLKSVDNMKGNALHQASVWQQTDMINFLIEKGFDINSKAFYDATPLHWAVWGMRANRVTLKDQYANCIKTILELGGNKSLKAQGGKTAADWATERNLTDIAKMLTP